MPTKLLFVDQDLTRQPQSRFRPHALCAAIMALGAGTALAQTTEPAQQVQIKGKRVLDKQVQEERQATGVLDVIDISDITLQSQTSIADLARSLPGVSTSKDQGRNQTATGESQYATIRGLAAGFNAYTLDGLRLPQTSGSSRAISLNLFSPFAVSTLVVDKTPGADRDADAIAGIIDLRTPTAFDFSGSLTRARVLGIGAQQALKAGVPGSGGALGVDLARRLGDGGRTGIYAAAYIEQRDSSAESVAVQNDYKTTQANVGTARANEAALSADGIQWNHFLSQVKRYGATLSVDHRADDYELRLRANAAEYRNVNTMNQVGLRNEVTSGQSRPDGSNYLNGVYTPWGVNPANYVRVEDVEQTLHSLQLGGNKRMGDWQASADVAWAKGRFDQPTRIEAAFRGISYIGTADNTGVATEGVAVDLSNPKLPRPVLSSGAAAYVASLSRPNQIYIQQGYDFLSEEKQTVKGELAWSGNGLWRRAAVGGLYEASQRSGRSLAPDATRYRFKTALQSGTVDGLSVNAFGGQLLGSLLGQTLPRDMKLFSRSQLAQQVAQYVDVGSVAASVLNNGLTDADEQRAALYASGTLTTGTLEVVGGLRYERNRYSAQYWLSDADGARFVEAGRDSNFLAPSLLLAWRPHADWVGRAALRRGYSRPSFDMIAGKTSITRDPVTDEITAISQPNPDLKPVQATSLDLGLDYEAREGRRLQLAAYHKQLKNIIVSTATTTETVGGITYSRPVNGREGSVTGMEVSGLYTFDPLPLLPGRFSLGGSVTRQSTRAEYVTSGGEVRQSTLPQAPSLFYNARLLYKGDKAGASLQYNWTGRYVTVLQTNQPDIYVQPASELNLNLSYELSKNVEVGLGVLNLLDSHAYWATVGESARYVANDRNGGYIKTGRVFMLSLRAQL